MLNHLILRCPAKVGMIIIFLIVVDMDHKGLFRLVAFDKVFRH